MTHTEIKNFGLLVNEKFDQDKHSVLKLVGADIFGTPEILRFSGFDSNEPLDTVLTNGIVSLRPGVYKIIDAPFYRQILSYPTFAVKVHYFANPADRLIEYTANIGPMTNRFLQYKSLGGPSALDEPFHTFMSQRATDDASTFYYESKRVLFDKIYLSRKIFRVYASVPAPDNSSQKKISWGFIT